jgi:hypothetical protein
MKRASYREAVAWIALNDDAGAAYAMVMSEVAGMISVVLVADLFGKEPHHVATDVIKYRAAEAVRRATERRAE